MSDLFEKLAEQGIPTSGLRSGDNYTICPACSHRRKPANQKKKCLGVKLDEDGGAVWRCNHCEWSGNVAGGHYDPHRTRETPKPKPAVQVPKDEPRPANLVAWFANRGIGEELLEQHHIHMRKVWFPQTETEEWAVAFPYFEGQRVVNNKYRMVKAKHFRQDKQAKKTLFNVNSIQDSDVVVWAEGEMDVLALEQAGFPQVVSVPDGAPEKAKEEMDPDDRRYEAVANCAEALAPIERHVLATDNDAAGDAHAEELARRLGKERCWRVHWPEGCKDANDVLIKHGPERLVGCIDNAVGYPVDGLVQLEPGALLRYRNEKAETTYSMGWSTLDRWAMLPASGAVVVVTGIPNMGKSEWWDDVMVRMSKRYGWTWAVFSPENGRIERHAEKLAEKWVGQPFRNRAGHAPAMPDIDVRLAQAWINRHFSFIKAELDQPTTVDFILDKARIAAMRYGIRGLVVDPYNSIQQNRARDETQTDWINNMLWRFRKFGVRHGCNVIIVAHPTKMERGSGAPTLYDIAGAAHWANHADFGFTVHRPTDEGYGQQVHVNKVRDKHHGQKGGTVGLTWNPQTGRYYEGDDEDASQQEAMEFG